MIFLFPPFNFHSALMWVPCRQHIVGLYFLSILPTCLLIGVVRQYTFKLMIDTLGFSLHFITCVLFVPFVSHSSVSFPCLPVDFLNVLYNPTLIFFFKDIILSSFYWMLHIFLYTCGTHHSLPVLTASHVEWE